MALGNLETIVESATLSRVERLGHNFPSLPSTLLEMCVMMVMREQHSLIWHKTVHDASKRHGAGWRE